jgi:hypothetical protein
MELRNIAERLNEAGARAFACVSMNEGRLEKALSIGGRIFVGTVGCFAVMALITTGADAVTVESLRQPITDLKSEIFSWMKVAEMASVAVGGVFSIMKQSLTPFGIGAGACAGIHFGDKWIGDGSGALI